MIHASCASLHSPRRRNRTPVAFERGEDRAVEQLVLIADQGVRVGADAAQHVARREAVRVAVHRTVLDLVEQPCDPDLEELVQVGTGNAQKPEPLEERGGGVARLFEHPPVERELTELPVDVEIRIVER